MFVDQLAAGVDYHLAASAISMCLLSHHLLPKRQQAHHRFERVADQKGLRLTEASRYPSHDSYRLSTVGSQIRSEPPRHKYVDMTVTNLVGW